MKKLLCLLLVLAMVSCLWACDSHDADHTKPEDTSDKENLQISFTEMTVVDNDECTVKITRVDPENSWGFAMEVYLENKSEDITYTFCVDECNVNGVENDPYFYKDVKPGSRTREMIVFSNKELAQIIGTFTDIALKFEVSDSGDWMAEPVAQTTVHVYPYGQEKATVYVREAKDTDTVLVDNEDVKLVVTGYEYDDALGYRVNLYHENKTDNRVMFSADAVSVNGYMCDPFYAHSVSAGAISFSSIYWSDEDFAANGITQVQQIEMILRIYNDEDWSADDLVKEAVTLTPDFGGNAGADSGGSRPEDDFEVLTVVDNDDCIIRITGIEEDALWGFTLKVYLENKSADTTYHFAVEEAAVNGVENDPYFGVDIGPGKKSNEEISFLHRELEEVIGAFTDVALTFQVSDAQDWGTEPIVETEFHVYPLGEENATIYDRAEQETDIVLVDNAYVTVTVIGCGYDETWGHSVELFLVNKTDTQVMFSTDDVRVNGIDCDPYFACSVNAGNCAFASMDWFSSDFEANGITQIEKVEMLLRAYNNLNWIADDFVNENVTLVP